MTISNSARTAGPFIGNGTTTAYPFSFKVFARGDLLVARTDLAGTETILTLDADYSVTLNSNQGSSPGGMVTLSSALPSGYTLAMTTNIPMTQGLDLTNNGGFYPAQINDALDRIVVQIQQIAAKVGGGLNIGAASVVQTIAKLQASSGASGVGFTQGGVGPLARTVQDELRERVSITQFGAVGDGVKVNTDAIQKAIDYVATLGGGYVTIPIGSFLSGAITLKTGVSLVGQGLASKLVVAAGTSDFLIGTGLANITLADFYIDGTNQAAAGGCGMKLDGFADSLIRNVTVYNAGSFGWLIFNAVRSKFIGNTINTTRKWDGMTISTGSVNNIIQGNTVLDSYDSGIGMTDSLGTVCMGNVVKRSKIGGQYFAPGIDAAGAKNASITGNYLIGNKFGISLLQHPNTGKKTKRVTVSGNTVADGQYGVICGLTTLIPPAVSEATTMDGIVITGNTIFAQDVAGVHLDNTLGAQVSGNSISSCAGNGVEQAATDRSVIVGNYLRANAIGVHVNVDSTCTNTSVALNNFDGNTVSQITGTYGTNPYFAHNRGAEAAFGNISHDPIPQAFIGCTGAQNGNDTALTALASAVAKGAANFVGPASYTAATITSQSVTPSGSAWFHFIGQSGNGTSVTTNNILISGNGNIQNANNSYGAISDAKLKEDVSNASPKLADLMRVRVVNYRLKADPAQKQLGVIAQELEQVFPNMVEETPDVIVNDEGETVPTGTVTKSVKYSVFVPMLVKALQELKTEFDTYRATHP